MDLDLVGYLLNLLHPDERVRTESAIRADPAVAFRLERLRANLAPLALARDDGTPPAGLVERTLARVFNRPVPIGRVPPPIGSDREPVFGSPRWRRADAVVAACILVMIGGLGMSGLSRLRAHHQQVVCANNLHLIHNALENQAGNRGGRFPLMTPQLVATGGVVPMLQQAGQLPAGNIVMCPSVVQITNSPNGVGYAYTMGYIGSDGQIHPLRRDEGSDTDLLPIMADRPANPQAGIRVSHGSGFNVLYIGGNVRFCITPTVGVNGDHIFINQNGVIAPGLHRLDTVLVDYHISP